MEISDYQSGANAWNGLNPDAIQKQWDSTQLAQTLSLLVIRNSVQKSR